MKNLGIITKILVVSALLFFAETAYTQKASKSFQVKPGDEMELKVTGDLNFSVWNKDEILIQAENVNTEDPEALKMTQSGNTVTVIYSTKKSYGGGAVFKISIPTQTNLKVKTSGGDILLSGSLKGKLSGNTAGGDIILEKIFGDVTMSTSGGDIKAEEISGLTSLATSGGDISIDAIGNDGDIKTSGGDIVIKSAAKSLSVATSGGDISVGSTGKDLKAATSGGDIKAGDIGGELKVATSGGNIEVNSVAGFAKLATSGGDIKLNRGNNSVSASTSGGDINLLKVYGSVQAKTSGGSIAVELTPDNKEESKIISSAGDITLSIPENANATIDATIRVSSWNSRKNEYKIKSDFKVSNLVQDDDKEEIRGEIQLNSGGKTIKLVTSSSNIIIKKLNK